MLGNLAGLALTQGRFADARAQYEAALAVHREVGNRRSEGSTHRNLAVVCRDQGCLGDARAHYEAALGLWREMILYFLSERGSGIEVCRTLSIGVNAAGSRFRAGSNRLPPKTRNFEPSLVTIPFFLSSSSVPTA